MHRLHPAYRFISLIALSVCLGACSGAPTYNPTTFPYVVDQERLDKNPVKTVIIAHVNLGTQSRNYLEKEPLSPE